MIRKLFLLSILLLLCFTSLSWALGTKELATQNPGEGVLVSYSIAHPGTTAKWTRTYIFRHNLSGKQFRISLSDRTRIGVQKLPEGDYSFIKTIYYRDGEIDNELTGKASQYSYNFNKFSIYSGKITPMPFVVYYYNTGAANHLAARNVSMPENTAGWRIYSGQITTDNVWKTAYYAYNKEFETDILEKLQSMEGFEKWDFISPLDKAYITDNLAKDINPSKIMLYCSGINSYYDSRLNLKYAENNANRVSTELASWLDVLDVHYINTAPYTDKQINFTKDRIFNIHETLSGDDYSFIFYFSGHLAADFKGRPYILFHNSELSSLQSDSLAVSDLINYLSEQKGSVLLILDCGRKSFLSAAKPTHTVIEEDHLKHIFSNLPENISVLLPNGLNLFTEDNKAFPDSIAKVLPRRSSELYQQDFWEKALSASYPDMLWF